MILWLNPATGISGDMLLGALLDLGAPLDGVRRAIASTGLTGWSLDFRREHRGALLVGRALVEVDDEAGYEVGDTTGEPHGHGHPHSHEHDGGTASPGPAAPNPDRSQRDPSNPDPSNPDTPVRPVERSAAALLAMVRRAEPGPVADLAARAVSHIAAVEGALHGEDPALVRLHEIGGLDTVVDTVGVAAALHLLGVTEVHCGPLALGVGTVRTRHGEIPVPAPATTAMLVEAGAEVVGSDIRGETVTPTGAALLLAANARFGPMPRLRLDGVGYGAGGRDIPGRPNALQALLGTPSGAHGAGVDELTLLETNVDDVTGELLGHVIRRAFDAGARDAWVTPIVMKKSRPAHTVHVLATRASAEELERLLFAETGTLGIRRSEVRRTAAARRVVHVMVAGHAVRVTFGPHRAKPEYDDVAAAAAALDLPLREVTERALREAERAAASGPVER